MSTAALNTSSASLGNSIAATVGGAQADSLKSLFLTSTIWAVALMTALCLYAQVRFGSLAVGLKYLNGQRLIVDPSSMSYEAASHNALGITVHNYTGRPVTVVGYQSEAAFTVEVEFPVKINSDQTLRLPLRMVGVCDKIGSRSLNGFLFTDFESAPLLPFAVIVSGGVQACSAD